LNSAEERQKERQPAMGRHGLIHRIARSLLPTIRCIALVLSASVIVICCWPLPDQAESPKSIGLELNKLEQQGGNCRAYLVIANPANGRIYGVHARPDRFRSQRDDLATPRGRIGAAAGGENHGQGVRYSGNRVQRHRQYPR
jgi:hypothetical protein